MSIQDQSAFFDRAIAVAAEGIGLVVFLGEHTDWFRSPRARRRRGIRP
ncbi:hypothetical protein [Streptomyces sp. YGL11-2]